MAYKSKTLKNEHGKECTKCSVFKPWSEFQKDKNTKDGHTSLCRECRKQNCAKWKAENPDKAKSSSDAWKEANIDKVRAQARAAADRKRELLGADGWNAEVKRWNDENPEKLAAQRKAHYAANRQRLRQKQKLDRELRPDAYRAYDAKKRAQRKNGYCPWADHNAIQAAYDYARYMTEETGVVHHVDHIVPLVNPLVQGLHVEHNLRVITSQENLEKGNKFEL